MTVTSLIEAQGFIAAGILVYWAIILVVLINDQRDPTKTIAWLLILILLPVVGLVFYYFAGRNWKKKTMNSAWLVQVRAAAAPVMARVRESYSADSKRAVEWMRERGMAELPTLISRTDGAQAAPAYEVEILPDGASKFARLEADLALARETINLQYYIWEHDELTARITGVLLDRIAAGVEVRILNDFIGNMPYGKAEIRRLREAGARIDYDAKDLGRANYRNHRKIAVIDGVIGYTGGINIGQEYIDGGTRFPSWRDTHVRFTGPAVADLQYWFAVRWFEVEKENLFTQRFFPHQYPASGEATMAQVVATGVEDQWSSATRAHVAAMNLATRRLWLQSPYFVPNDAVFDAMVNAALGGLDVRLMITGWPDKRIAWYAARTYFRPLLEAGARIYYYDAGFMHAKTLSVDGQVLSIGTLNLDIRSLELHKELMVWFYDEELTRSHDAIFERDLVHCSEVTLDFLDTMPRWEVFRDSAARLASNLL